MRVWILTITVLGVLSPAAAQDDVLIADFEGPNYGLWRTTGEAFGVRPARGTLTGQLRVSGYQGQQLANSFYNGDRSVGTLTSPVFKIERRYINFL
ncbi:MAG: GH32 C-terminal domain-containing protein, partial [Planctomycetota bacterium]